MSDEKPEELESLRPVDAGGKALFHHTGFRVGLIGIAVVFVAIISYTFLAPPPPPEIATEAYDPTSDAPVIESEDDGPIQIEPEIELESPILTPPPPPPPPPPVEPVSEVIEYQDGVLGSGQSVSIVDRSIPNRDTPLSTNREAQQRAIERDIWFAPASAGIQGVSLDQEELGEQVLAIGDFIELTMMHNIVSDSPTPMKASVSRPVYSANGEIIIPRGAVFVGTPSGVVRDRIVGLWEILQLPDGRQLRIEAMLTDRTGRGGIEGKLHRDMLKRLGGGLARATAAAGAAVGVNMTTPDEEVVQPETGAIEGDNNVIQSVPVVVTPKPTNEDIAIGSYVQSLSNLAMETAEEVGRDLDVRVETTGGALAGAVFTKPLYVVGGINVAEHRLNTGLR